MEASSREVLRTCDPDPDAMLLFVGRRVNEQVLREIAEADYGIDSDTHLAALRSISRTGKVPKPPQWEPREVCELTQWGLAGAVSSGRAGTGSSIRSESTQMGVRERDSLARGERCGI
jgi:hypothetical protein